ncbi:MAG: helix-turn-helix transcriptional regulator [Hyphomicrobiaceae bacterium]
MRDQLRNSIDIQIGERVAKHRHSASVSVEAAAERCGSSPDDYVAGELGERRFRAEELFELATCFGVRFSTFVAGLELK